MFMTAITIMLLQKDIHTLLQPHKTNLLLIIPTTTLLQAILPTAVPSPLKLPSYFLLTVFSAAILAELYQTLSPKNKSSPSPPVSFSVRKET
jgi:hypothetical protein